MCTPRSTSSCSTAVLPRKLRLSRDKQYMYLSIPIDEGPVYHFGETEVVCNVPGLDSGDLQRLLVDGASAEQLDALTVERAG